MSRVLLSIALVSCFAASAVAQATRPAPEGWSRAVADFAGAISTGDDDTARASLQPQADIKTFTPSRDGNLKNLIDLASAATLVSAHGYIYPPTTLAGDLAADVAASDAVPSEVKRRLAIDAEARAGDTAVKWVSNVLGAENGNLVGIIAIWNPRGDNAADGTVHAIFILIKGVTNDGGKYLISKIVYGDPLK